jgi:hypothetical protein
MHISPSIVVAYECSFEQAADIYSQHSLRHCEALPWSVVTFSFQSDSDLVAFKLAFGETIDFDDETAIILPDHQDAVERFLKERVMTHPVIRKEILWVEFWNAEDWAIFDDAFTRV